MANVGVQLRATSSNRERSELTLLARRLQRSLGDDAIVLGVRFDPEPQNAVGDINGQGALVRTDAHEKKSKHTLEVQGRMAWVLLKNSKLLVS